jgi:hypothetical protein
MQWKVYASSYLSLEFHIPDLRMDRHYYYYYAQEVFSLISIWVLPHVEEIRVFNKVCRHATWLVWVTIKHNSCSSFNLLRLIFRFPWLKSCWIARYDYVRIITDITKWVSLDAKVQFKVNKKFKFALVPLQFCDN